MESEFIVSAIISTYNAEKFISGCLQDLIEQTLYQRRELEIIVIDSASLQDEKSIVKQFQAHYPNIIYEQTQERETIYAAWNRAIKLSHGRYITNANTDDRRRSDALEVMADHLDKYPDISLVYADQLITSVANETFAKTQTQQQWDWPSYSYEELKKRCCVGSQPMWRKSLHDNYGYFRAELHCAGDYEFWLRIASQGKKLTLIPQVLGLYYRNPEGIEHSVPGRASVESKKIRKEYGIPIATKKKKASKPLKNPNTLLIPLSSLVIGVSLSVASIMLDNQAFEVRASLILLSFALILGMVGYWGKIPPKILRIVRLLIATFGLLILLPYLLG